MAIKDGSRPPTTEILKPDLDTDGSTNERKKIPAPYFGRTARVVTDWESVDASDPP